MKNYIIKRYETKSYSDWNAFISTAKNATFLFNRDFMDYHSDRFEDFSLLIYDEDKLVAVLPANRLGTTVFSHQGLTYGGLVLSRNSKLYNIIFIFKSILMFLNENAISTLIIKKIPSIYCDTFSDEIDYLVSICNGTTKMKHAISVINLDSNFKISKSRRECINRGKKLNLVIKEENNLVSFWNDILIPNLKEKYNSKPVHSLDEIIALKAKFPQNIKHFNVYSEGKMVCGTTLFITKNVVKAQYISGNEDNNLLGSIDYLYDFLINEVSKGKSYFDFGPSHENNGLNIVKNINFWKESFGVNTLVQNFYEVETSNYPLLDNILI
ncbi:MAG: GNAT family N-acetyltransferase [Flavobacteriaceae bacterium]|nr:GNAT family N-acetyltransferase [Flavobacteriaceae bacterium]